MNNKLTDTEKFLVNNADISIDENDEDIELVEDGSEEDMMDDEFYLEDLDPAFVLQSAADAIKPTANKTKYIAELNLTLEKEKMKMMRLAMLDILEVLVEIRDSLSDD